MYVILLEFLITYNVLIHFSYKCSVSANYTSDQFYPNYHFAQPYGWMSNLNGFCVFNNEFYIFYEYNPVINKSIQAVQWVHAKSNDLFHWKFLEAVMYPDKNYNKIDEFSGSAIVVNNTLNLFYTKNAKHSGKFTKNTGSIHHQALAYTTDGLKFTPYSGNLVILGEENQANIRDPKVWQYGDTFYMIVGDSLNNTFGRVMLYSSKNLISWQSVTVLNESDGRFGNIWKRPDFFELNGKFVLIFSPQGMNTGYIVGDFDYESSVFIPISIFKLLDYGHDFQATQTTLDAHNRRIMLAGFGMMEEVYPERFEGWAGQLTIPRILYLTSHLKLIQKPMRTGIRNKLLYSGFAPAGTSIQLTGNTGEITITGSKYKNLNIIFESGNVTVIVKYDKIKAEVSLNRGGKDAIRKTKWRPQGRLRMQIFIDRSSIELFCGIGEVTFSSRFYPYRDIVMKLGENSNVDNMLIYSLGRTIQLPDI